MQKWMKRLVKQMAVTKIIKVKANVGGCIDYARKDGKTENGLHVSYYGCGKSNAEFCFLTALSNNDCNKDQLPSEEVKAYHIIQSFAKTDSISAEEANQIGQQMMDELFDGKYAFVCATHIDKGHIHNHIVVCASEMAMNGKKINDDLALLYKIRRTSDKLCKEHGLDVIEKPMGKGKSYKEWLEDKTNPNGSKKTQLRNLIDEKIRVANDFDDFIEKMKEAGAEISFGTSKKYGQVTKYKLPGATENDRWNRGYNLGSAYSDDAISRRITNRIHREEEREARKAERAEARKAQRAAMSKADKAIDRTKLKIEHIIDTSNDEVTSQNIGLERWRNRQNAMLAEEMKKTLKDRFGIDYTQIRSHINSLTADNNRLESEIQSSRKSMETLRLLIESCQVYMDTQEVASSYESARDQEKYYQKHDSALNAYFDAETFLKRVGVDISSFDSREEGEKYIKALQDRLEKTEKEIAGNEAEIKQNERDIAELKGYQEDLDRYHGRKQGLD